MKTIIRLASTLTISALLFSCSTQKTEADDDKIVDNNNFENTVEDGPSADSSSEDDAASYVFLSNEAPAALTKAEKEKVININNFAFNFARKINNKVEGNSFVSSPVSMAYLLGMLSAGAVGQTREEILNAMGLQENSQKEINEFCRDLMVLSSRSAGSQETLELSNAYFYQEPYAARDSYCKTVKNYYDAFVSRIEKDPVPVVNAWIEEKTHGRIKDALGKKDECLLYLVNTMFFKAAWKDGFDEYLTKEKPFNCEDGSSRTEKMMMNANIYEGGIHYADFPDYSTVRLLYGSDGMAGNYSMYIMLPKTGICIDDVLNQLDGEAWAKLASTMERVPMELSIPRFEVNMNEELNDVMQALGIKLAFSRAADFSEMTSEGACISLIKHIANITVDEKGTEAAAASIAEMGPTSPGPGEKPEYVSFTADHPFIFAIAEETTGALLFLGTYK